MMKNKLDIGLLAPIISSMAIDNEEYSKMIAEVLLKAMNSYDEVEDKSIVFSVTLSLFRTCVPSCWWRMISRCNG
jgi:DNA-binding LacI/PurR family transcriptional regulator